MAAPTPTVIEGAFTIPPGPPTRPPFTSVEVTTIGPTDPQRAAPAGEYIADDRLAARDKELPRAWPYPTNTEAADGDGCAIDDICVDGLAIDDDDRGWAVGRGCLHTATNQPIGRGGPEEIRIANTTNPSERRA